MTVIQLKNANADKLGAEIQSHLTRGEAEYIAAGQKLRTLKDMKPDGVTWANYVKEKCGLGRDRADELIRIADGKTTVTEVRAKNAEKKQRYYDRLRGENHQDDPTEEDDAPDIEFKTKTEKNTWACGSLVSEAFRMATDCLRLSSDITVTKASINEARRLAAAWGKLVEKMEQQL